MKRSTLGPMSLLTVAVTVLGAIALLVVPYGVGPESAWWPKFTVAVVFFWLVHRARAMPVLAVLAIGVVQDLVAGGVVGAGALPLVIASAVMRQWSEPLSGSRFLLRWFAFAGFAAFVLGGEWALTGLARLTVPPLNGPLAQFFVTVLAYLPISVFFRRVLRIGRT